MNLRKIIRISAIAALSLSLSNLNAASNHIGYQGIAFDNGSALVEQNISLRFTVYQNNGSTLVYQETKTGIRTTNKGFFSHKIGSGVKSSSSPLWSNVAWNDNYKLKVEIDKNNGTSFVNLGTQDLISVAYAKKSEKATSATTLTGLTSSVAELNHVDGVSSNIQTQLDGKMKRGFTNNPPSDIQVALVKTNGELTYHTTVESTELSHLNGVTSNIQGQLDDKASNSHTHSISNITNLQTELNKKLSTTGNAVTATKLKTARTLNGRSFDGSANVTFIDPYINAENTADATKYLTFSTSSTAGYKRIRTDENLQYNPSTNTLTASVFSGKATTLKTETDTTNATRYIPFISSSNTDAKFLRRDSALNYNPSTDTLRVPKLNIGGTTVTDVHDEDTMSSDSATALATQQSIKAYVDSAVSGVDTSALLPKSGGTMTGRLLFDRQTYIGNDTDASKVDLFGWREDNQFRVYLNNNNIYLSTELGALIVNESGDIADIDSAIDFRVESKDKNHMIFSDASANRVGIGKKSSSNTPPTLSYTLDITGTLGVTGTVTAPTFDGKATGVKTVTDNENATKYIPFISATNGDSKYLRRDSALNYNPSTDTLTVPKLNIGGTTATHVYDEDTMSSNSASALATQQSIKAYVDNKLSSNTQGVKKGFTTNPSTYTRVALVKTDGSLIYKSDISSTELGYLNNVSSNIQTQLTNINTQLSGKASSSHNHDSTYLKKSGGTISGDLKIGSSSTTYAPLHVETMRTQRISGGSNGGENRWNYFHWNTALKHKREAFNYLISIYAKGSVLTEHDIVAISDKRTKKDIKPIKSSLETIKKLRPVHYKKVDEYSFGSKRNYGFIAQELEEVLPEAVNTSKGAVPILKPFDKVEFEDGVTYVILVKNGDEVKEQKYTTKDKRPDGEIIVKSKEVDDLKSVTYDMVFTVAVDAIQEQQEEIESLKSQLDAIKKALTSSGIAIK